MAGDTTGTTDVDAWLDEHAHDLTAAARVLRAAILRAVPDAVESIKWKAPNFAADDDFATFSMRRPGVLQVILHTGAALKPDAPRIEAGDLGELAPLWRWASHNRAVITFISEEQVNANRDVFERVVRDWVAQA